MPALPLLAEDKVVALMQVHSAGDAESGGWAEGLAR